MMMLDVKGYEKLYRVSQDGRIYSYPRQGVPGHSLYKKIPQLHPKGYHIVQLCKGGKPRTEKLHRLVATTFIDNPNSLPEVNHINGVKTDNRVKNLEWCTHSGNLLHAYRIGLKTNRGINNPNHRSHRAERQESSNAT